MAFELFGHRAAPSPGGETELKALVHQYCGTFGPSVCDLIIRESAEPKGLVRLLRRLRNKPPETLLDQVILLSQWIRDHGERALFRAVAEKPDLNNFSLKPVESVSQAREHDHQVMEGLLRKQRMKAALNALPRPLRPPSRPPTRPPSRPSTAVSRLIPKTIQPPPLPIRKPPPQSQGQGFIPIFKPYPKAKSLRGRPENPFSGSARQCPAPPRPTRAYTPPPGYPWPWPSHLKPGPEPPPPTIPPHQLTWPYIDRRVSEERRKNNDRRQELNVVFKNRRFGGDRRKRDRRKH